MLAGKPCKHRVYRSDQTPVCSIKLAFQKDKPETKCQCLAKANTKTCYYYEERK